MLIVPLQAVPSQVVRIVLNEQNCTIAVYQKSGVVYLDLTVDNTIIWTCSICQNNAPICAYRYIPFIGELTFKDTQGINDPDYTGFNSRYVLYYIFPDE